MNAYIQKSYYGISSVSNFHIYSTSPSLNSRASHTSSIMLITDHDDSSINNNESTRNTTNSTIKNPTLGQTSLYHLILVENPCIVLVTPQLSENNYEYWSRSMKPALLSENKIKFINGKITAPMEDDALFDTWEGCNNIVLAWIFVSLSPDITQSTIYMENGA